MWNWRRKRREGFPSGFRVQRIWVEAAKAISHLPAAEIATYMRRVPETANALLNESYDTRFSPSTFITEDAGVGYSVGWFSTDKGYECVQNLSTLAEAATDYLLFSLGKGRWKPPRSS
jgi:hypothetical protein